MPSFASFQPCSLFVRVLVSQRFGNTKEVSNLSEHRTHHLPTAAQGVAYRVMQVLASGSKVNVTSWYSGFRVGTLAVLQSRLYCWASRLGFDFDECESVVSIRLPPELRHSQGSARPQRTCIFAGICIRIS